MKQYLSLAFFAALVVACPSNNDEKGEPPSATSYREYLESTLSRNARLVERAQEFDQVAALDSFGFHPANGYSYRFDDHLEEAIISDPRADQVPAPSRSISLELLPVRSAFKRTPKGVRIDFQKGDVLRLENPIEVPESEVEEIEIRIKVHRTRQLKLGWSSETGLARGPRETSKVALATVDTTPDGLFHTYRVNASALLRKRIRPGDFIRDVFIRPSETQDDELEIESIRLVSQYDKYNHPPYGTSYVDIGHEWRRVMYTGSSVETRFRLDLPDEEIRLQTGLAISARELPVRFKIVVRHEGEVTSILDKRIVEANHWHEVDLDLSSWRKKSIEIEFLSEGESDAVGFWSSPIAHQKRLRSLNLLIVLQDALRADHLSTYGYQRITSPTLDEYAKRGAVFERAFSQATKTRPSLPSFMTGLYPTATGVWDFTDSLDERYVTLAEILRKQGFFTASFVPNGNAGVYAGLQQGFDQLVDDYPDPGEEHERIYGAGADTAAVMGETLHTWLGENRNRNFFAYIHVVDPHGPYDPPTPYDNWFRQEGQVGPVLEARSDLHDPEWYAEPTASGRRALYDGEIRNNDDYIDLLISELRALKLLDDTLLIFLADHGEHLGEHGLWEHHPPGYTQVLRVPLVIVFPGIVPSKLRITENVQLVDLLPTILQLMGIVTDSLLLQGDSLVPLMKETEDQLWSRRPVVSDEVIGRTRGDSRPWGSVFIDRWHVLSSQRFFNRREHKDSRTDPAERLEIYDHVSDLEEARGFVEEPYLDFGAEISSFLGALQTENINIHRALTSGPEPPIRIDPETRRRLRALGYFE